MSNVAVRRAEQARLIPATRVHHTLAILSKGWYLRPFFHLDISEMSLLSIRSRLASVRARRPPSEVMSTVVLQPQTPNFAPGGSENVSQEATELILSIFSANGLCI